ncbi:MAG: hypothetical protein WBO55_09855 [Rhizobiaceae bacterium]
MTDILAGLLAVLVVVSGTLVALAQVADTEAGMSAEAAAELTRSVMQHGATGQVLRLSDLQGSQLFDALLPRGAVSHKPAELSELAILALLIEQSGDVAGRYILAGTGASDPKLLDKNMQAAASSNFIRYLPEIARIYDFRVGAAARLADGSERFRVSLSKEQLAEQAVAEGLDAVGTTISSVLTAVLGSVADQNIDVAWRLERAIVLNENVAALASFLDIRRSQQIADMALAAAISEPEAALAGRLKDFALAILR